MNQQSTPTRTIAVNYGSRSLFGNTSLFAVMLVAMSWQSVMANETSDLGQQLVPSSVWYDADQGQLQPVPIKVQKDDSLNRSSRWLPQANKVTQGSSTSGSSNIDTSAGLFGTGLTFWNLVGWLLLILLVGSAGAIIAFVLSRAEVDFTAIPSSDSRRGTVPDQQTVERMKHLPAELRRTDVNLRDEAERLMQEKQFDQAVILLFAHQLLLLDRAHLLRLNRGKTNRRYVRETRRASRQCAELLQDTVNAFERSFFGHHAITEDEFNALWQANLELEKQVRQRMGAAA